jgi:hypothetical protein
MASLTNNITTSVTIGTTTYNLTVSESITLTDDNVVHQTLSVPTSEVDLATIGAVGPAGLSDLAFLLVVNRDGTNFIRLRLEDTGGHTADFKVPAGQSLMIKTKDINVSATGGAFASFSSIDTIAAQADTASCDVEIFLAY